MLRINNLTGFGSGGDQRSPTITSTNLIAVPDGDTLAFTITTDETTTITIGGADAAELEIVSNVLSSTHTLQWLSNGTRSFASPVDTDANNIYEITLTATDAVGYNSIAQMFYVVVLDAAVTLDGTLTNATLSGGDLIASHSNTTLGGARTTNLQDSGKFYFEIDLNNITGFQSCVGILTSGGTYTNLALQALNCASVYLGNSGIIWSNDSNSGKFIGELAIGDIIGIAVDLDSDKVWFRKLPSGNWNGEAIGSQDPANGVGGVSISSYSADTIGPALAFGGSGTAATEQFIVNFGVSAFVGLVPATFWPWGFLLPAVTFDSTPVNVTVSGAGLIATHANTTLGEVRSTVAKNSGKFYYEVTVDVIAGSNSSIGICTIGASTFDLFGAVNACSVWHDGTGHIYVNGVSTGLSIGNLAASDVIGIAVDLDNNKVWFRKSPSGNWNGLAIGSQDPSGNVGGASISAFSATTLQPFVSYGGTGTSASEQVTANFGVTAFSGAVPSGFVSGWTP